MIWRWRFGRKGSHNVISIDFLLSFQNMHHAALYLLMLLHVFKLISTTLSLHLKYVVLMHMLQQEWNGVVLQTCYRHYADCCARKKIIHPVPAQCPPNNTAIFYHRLIKLGYRHASSLSCLLVSGICIICELLQGVNKIPEGKAWLGRFQ